MIMLALYSFVWIASWSQLVSQYIFSVVIFIMDNRDDNICNYDVHKRNTRQESNLHQPTVSLALYQKGIINMGIKIYNNLPSFIKETYTTPKIFKSLLKNFLYSNSFYSLDEYFNYNVSQYHISLCILIHTYFLHFTFVCKFYYWHGYIL
jgi:hypothetical protein